MTTCILDIPEIVHAVGRATMYSLLSGGLGFPRQEVFDSIEGVLIPAALSLDLPQPLHSALMDLDAAMPDDLLALRRDHTRLFPPITSQDAPGYETAYRGDGVFQQSGLLADIAGFYRAQGLRAGGAERERFDHIVVELEFMAVLARKEILARKRQNDEETSICLDMSAMFLRDHLGCWAGAFGRRAAAVAGNAWYQTLGGLVANWVSFDAEMLEVEPVEVADDPLPIEPPDDGSCGPCPVPEMGVTP